MINDKKMKYLLFILIITAMASCNDSAKEPKPLKDNVVNKDTAVKDTMVIH